MKNIGAGHVIDCALAGADIATVPYSVLEQMAKHPMTDAGIENKRRKPGLAHGECGSSGCFVKGFIMNDLELKKVAVDFPGRYGHRKPTKPVNTETACIITETCWEFS